MHKLLLLQKKNLIGSVKIISLSYDGMTTSNQQSWDSIHAYIIEVNNEFHCYYPCSD
jgi:hypothetical protein